MLYILLIIIAIGVLLASEAGQALLGLLIKLALIAGGLYLVFWIVVIVISLLSNKGIRDDVFIIISGSVLSAGFLYWMNKKVYKFTEWKQHKLVVISYILAFSVLATIILLSALATF